jgi:NDP-sugar pyrophosphorylase family protein
MRVEVSREEVLLDTGGGLKKAAHFFLEDGDRANEPFILHNVDVVSTLDLRRMMQFHVNRGALATLAVQNRQSSRYLVFDEQLHLCGRRTESQTEMARSCERPSQLAFCGIHVISPRIFSCMSEQGIYPIIPCYLRLAGEGQKILAFQADEYYWRDLGKPENVTQAARDINEGIVL